MPGGPPEDANMTGEATVFRETKTLWLAIVPDRVAYSTGRGEKILVGSKEA
jgi:hypothetical protein